jgi:lysophospholipase L1-like esterase
VKDTRHFARYVAIGDSSTEGLDDPDGRGGYRGWANRLAERIARVQGSLNYANLGVRGRRTRRIREEQLEPALAMRPDLVTLFSGTNDVIGGRFDVDAVAADIEAMHRALIGAGATVLTFTLPDLSPVMPVARMAVARVRALNAALRAISARSGVILVDVAMHGVASDPRLWSEDRLHANAQGHARIAHALAHALGIPNADDSWSRPLDPAEPTGGAQRLVAEARWARRYFLPWAWRHMRGRSSGDGAGPKRPTLQAVAPDPDR